MKKDRTQIISEVITSLAHELNMDFIEVPYVLLAQFGAYDSIEDAAANIKSDFPAVASALAADKGGITVFPVRSVRFLENKVYLEISQEAFGLEK